MVIGFLLAFVPLFLAVWFLSLVLISHVGGWHDLALLYRVDAPIAGAREWHHRGGRMRNNTRYSGCLNIAANTVGLQLSLWPIFRPTHPPLFIPWTDIATEPVQGLFIDSVRFSFRRANTFLLLRRDLGEEILRAAGVTSAAWPVSPPRSFSSTP